MVKHVYSKDGMRLIRVEEATPVCSEDYCDRCGDCLYCFEEAPCLDGQRHFWVEYEGENDEQQSESL